MHALKEMPPDVRGLFDQVETLVRLLMVVPISSAEAERSFSGLRRMKTHGCDQPSRKKDSMALLCAIFTKRGLTVWTDKRIAQQYVQGNQRRRDVFGFFSESA